MEVFKMAHFGKTFRKLIKAKNLTFTAFADKAGVSMSVVTKSLKQEKYHGHRYVELAAGLGMTTEQLDAAWMDSGAETKTQAEEPIMDITAIDRLTFEQCDILVAALNRRMEQLRQVQNRNQTGPARTAS